LKLNRKHLPRGLSRHERARRGLPGPGSDEEEEEGTLGADAIETVYSNGAGDVDGAAEDDADGGDDAEDDADGGDDGDVDGAAEDDADGGDDDDDDDDEDDDADSGDANGEYDDDLAEQYLEMYPNSA
jgi:hypothetical protein